jgi:hypothetical protein
LENRNALCCAGFKIFDAGFARKRPRNFRAPCAPRRETTLQNAQAPIANDVREIASLLHWCSTPARDLLNA